MIARPSPILESESYRNLLRRNAARRFRILASSADIAHASLPPQALSILEIARSLFEHREFSLQDLSDAYDRDGVGVRVLRTQSGAAAVFLYFLPFATRRNLVTEIHARESV